MRERESIEDSTDCSQQEMFSLHSRSQRGCVAASPAGIPLPGPSPTPCVGYGTLSPARAHTLAESQLADGYSPAPCYLPVTEKPI